MIPATFSRLHLINLRELRTHWGRAAASVGVVAVSAALLVAVLGISGSATGSAERLANSIGGAAALEVSGVTDSGFDESLLNAVAGVKDVSAAVPVLRMQMTAHSDRFIFVGVDRSVMALQSDLANAVEAQIEPGSPLESIPDGVVVGPAIGVATGDQFDLASTRVTVAVVASGPSARRLNGGHFIFAPLALAQRITGREHRLDSIMVVTKPGADIEQVRKDVTAAVAGRAVVAEPAFRAGQTGRSLALLQSMMLLAASISFVVAAYLSYNAMSIAIAQRRPIISTLRALGGRRRTIVSAMLAEAAVLGFVGGVIGSVFGIFVGRISIGRLPPAIVESVEAHVDYVLPLYVVPVAIVACVVASVAASALAARQIHRVAPVEALAPIGVASTEAGSRPARIAAGVIGVILFAVTILLVTGDFGRIAVASMALAFVGGSAICFALSDPIIAAAAAVARLLGPAGALGAAAIERASRRMWVATMTVLTAVATTASVVGISSNAIDSIVASVSSTGDPDFWVSTTGPSDYPTATLLPADTESRVLSVPGVSRVVAEQKAFGTVGDIKVMLLGVAPGSHQPIYDALSTADREKLDAAEGVAVSRDLGEELGVSAGENVLLQTPSGERDVRVLDTVPYFSGAAGTIAIDLKTMQQWFVRPGATDLEITVEPGFDAASVRAAILKVVSADVFVYSGREALAGLRKGLSAYSAITMTIAWIVVVVSVVGLMNTLMLSVLDRRREIGVLRAMGATRRFTLNSILAEAGAIGIVGGLLGLMIGAASQYLTAIALTNALGFEVTYQAQPGMVAIGLGSLASCLVGAVPPAVRAARLNIVEAVSVE
ncbi:ABC transporter permease [Mycobacterium sp. MMS18-G62]